MPVATISRKISNIGGSVMDLIEGWGNAWIFLMQVLRASITPPYRLSLLIQQLYVIGAHSTLVIALIAAFTGAVLAVQAEFTLSKFGAVAFTGSAVALSLIRELGPVLTALMIIGRAGSATTAELGIMKITEQVDALRSMAVDPIKYLMVPRFLAAIITVPLLTALAIVIGIGGGYVVSVEILGLSPGTFMTQIYAAVSPTDIYSGLIKGLVFGFIFGWVSCFKGHTCGFGAIGVNRATTQAVVTASVAVLIVDYFLTSVLTQFFME